MNRTLGAPMLAALVLAAIAAFTGCSGDSENESAAKPPQDEGTVLQIRDTSKPGEWDFDTHRLTAKAGKVTIVFHNASGLGHNVRVHTGKCCLKPGYKDVGGTEVIGAVDSDKRETVKATLNLKPGTYTFLCPIAGHFQAGQHGTLVVE
ncbi:MAG: plastocyanin/azurin family copper-binding protein [Thermoleophilaceae bacterium]